MFTGGIGEHAVAVRASCGTWRRSASLNDVSVDGDRVVAATPIAVLVVAAREDVVIARGTCWLCTDSEG